MMSFRRWESKSWSDVVSSHESKITLTRKKRPLIFPACFSKDSGCCGKLTFVFGLLLKDLAGCCGKLTFVFGLWVPKCQSFHVLLPQMLKFPLFVIPNAKVSIWIWSQLLKFPWGCCGKTTFVFGLGLRLLQATAQQPEAGFASCNDRRSSEHHHLLVCVAPEADTNMRQQIIESMQSVPNIR